ncbi:MAG: biotin transporter BioY, partial [Myxococcota bacterium]
WDRSYLHAVLTMALGTALIFVCGLTWMRLMFAPTYTEQLPLLLTHGLYPYLPGAVLKLLVAAILLPSYWRWTQKNN